MRKELASVAIEQPGAAAFGTGIYTAEWTQLAYAECLRHAEELLFEGKRVLVDANFRDEACRRKFLDAATRWGAPTGILVCDADSEVVRERLKNRRNDVSDADWSVYQLAAEGWEEPILRPQSALQVIDTSGTVERAISQAIDALRQWDIYA